MKQIQSDEEAWAAMFSLLNDTLEMCETMSLSMLIMWGAIATLFFWNVYLTVRK